MDRDQLLYESWEMPDRYFPVILHHTVIDNRKGCIIFSNHWHERIEFLYFVKGKAVIRCNSKPIHVKEGDFIVVNSNDLHQGESASDNLEYYCIIVDTSLLQSRSTDACEVKYITPISENNILFKNKVSNDDNIKKAVGNIITEFEKKEIGYEMAIKSSIYNLLVLLLRNHIELVLTPKEYNTRVKNLDRFNKILQHIETHYAEDLNLDNLCSMANMSRYYFCRLFRQVTGKTLSDYINSVRINKAERLLKDSSHNITEVAMMVGFDNINYFSRLYKKYKKVPPSSIHKAAQNPESKEN
ncbi:hypothetical protein CDQ84_01935 [Clostridium thermosuccinogenes]|uniref:HTH araC/xylS-type domain-containing protein n=1 Tax=Clostridium thermosuccinogenes TaxID=84032 RepID=A0A2K2FLP6_9CLOT|nr:AraC family transcriptional regulator [Pseudoclostridium thermosuccinogenes]AUS96891.1 hypothetical protein CDO33_10855 [Pseudoclostridium thermosuccinogenes]PNT92442.1 hypothetical protein CDQ83_02385 [Pseudoclostridium thermosuccinogenes]PNT99692.1 hypothetical protein CDQ85_02400 [Pseudoclostridium thermosuccinogenes]PNU01174.1 hypothetical protein CDQ84_01935 [Pseudoclostridium thermosuccinogenes]